jgi:FtsP/CotA-like multicopper oxidase with cupredoxin domain
VNAALARVLDLRVDRHAALVMAIDGQPAEPFPARDSRVVLGPGNRVDLFVDMALAPGSRASILARTDRGEHPLVHLVYQRGTARASPLPEPKPLPGNPLPARLDLRGAARPDLTLGNLARSPLFRVARGRTVVLTCVNRSELVQAVHVHGHSCRLLDRLDDGWKPFWLDTITVDRRQTDRLAFLADNPGKWLIEVQALAAAHPAGGVWFEVT